MVCPGIPAGECPPREAQLAKNVWGGDPKISPCDSEHLGWRPFNDLTLLESEPVHREHVDKSIASNSTVIVRGNRFNVFWEVITVLLCSGSFR